MGKKEKNIHSKPTSQTESEAAAGENTERCRGTRHAFVCAGALSDKGHLVHMPDPKADPYLSQSGKRQ